LLCVLVGKVGMPLLAIARHAGRACHLHVWIISLPLACGERDGRAVVDASSKVSTPQNRTEHR
jgi:hypothetical protein